jgi:DHA2 family methylenomycin A resistance protein-like MFS transporter
MGTLERRMKALTLVVSCSGLFMIQLDLTIVNVALRDIQQSLGASVSGLQWVVDAYALVFAGLMLSAGDLGDLFGHRRVFLSGLGVFILGSIGCALAPRLTALIAARALQGVGSSALLPTSLAILNHAFSDTRERAGALGLWAGVSGLSLVAGPALGGFLVGALGWRSIFWINFPAGLAAVTLASWAVRESREARGRNLDVPGQLLGVIFLGALLFALIEGNGLGWGSTAIVAAFFLAATGFAAFVAVERRSAAPMIELRFFKNRTFSAANLASGTMNFAMFGLLFTMSLFFQQAQGFSPIETGLRMIPLLAPLTFLAPFGGRLVGAVGPRLPSGGLLLSALGMLVLSQIDAQTGYESIWPALLLTGLGLAPATPALVAAATGSVPSERAGMASAINNTARQGAGAFGVAILGGFLGSQTSLVSGMHLALLVGGMVLLSGGIVGPALIRSGSSTEGNLREQRERSLRP